MKRLTACLGAVAMFVALLTAPLFHFHDRDDHGSPVSLVHAHFLGSPEFAESDHHSDNAVESKHSHDKARWVEFFTFNGPQSSVDWAVGSIETLNVSTTEVRQGISILTVPRSHGPPGARPSIPRSPPTA